MNTGRRSPGWAQHSLVGIHAGDSNRGLGCREAQRDSKLTQIALAKLWTLPPPSPRPDSAREAQQEIANDGNDDQHQSTSVKPACGSDLVLHGFICSKKAACSFQVHPAMRPGQAIDEHGRHRRLPPAISKLECAHKARSQNAWATTAMPKARKTRADNHVRVFHPSGDAVHFPRVFDGVRCRRPRRTMAAKYPVPHVFLRGHQRHCSFLLRTRPKGRGSGK